MLDKSHLPIIFIKRKAVDALIASIDIDLKFTELILGAYHIFSDFQTAGLSSVFKTETDCRIHIKAAFAAVNGKSGTGKGSLFIKFLSDEGLPVFDDQKPHCVLTSMLT